MATTHKSTVEVGINVSTKPIWRSKKIWTAVVALMALVVVEATGREELMMPVMLLAMTLLTSIGLADFGKERAALELMGGRLDEASKNTATLRPPPLPPEIS